MAVTSRHERPAERGCQPLSFPAFVLFIAGMMAIPSLAFDSMLPALPEMGKSFSVTNPNDQQWIIVVYFLGIGFAQIFYGPLSDRFGRKPVLITGYILFILTSLMVGLSQSYPLLLAARLIQGVAAASSRVLATSIVRDCFSGRRMSKVMSFAVIIFMGVPIFAPSLGSVVLLYASWRAIFFSLTLFTLFFIAMIIWRLPETLHPEDRRDLDWKDTIRAAGLFFKSRDTVAYTLALMMIEGGLLGYLNSVVEIFTDNFHASPKVFNLAFAAGGGFMILACLTNSFLVEKVGMHRLGHGSLFMMIAMSIAHAFLGYCGLETAYTFVIMQGMTMFFFSLCIANFSAISMEPMGHIAGMASSIQGFIWLVGGDFFGAILGQMFNNTIFPMTIGNALYGLFALAIILWAEKGRLFVPKENQ
ncbi:Bcr/CflA subfamily drug resistance transporter [Zymomonas mobilis subsp. mobilis ZM4 = ATCC 31821]|uniref:Bcr/CflA family efflux transporter n=2 Tax=Zymomonas mobilis subsp. mobilis TaxID=120045 RepID=Q5NQ87_ZYMMO|nr:multidrug effflux MFS transporter [Zymomonas mobilis]AAV89118.1 drug resistance transporter, Bcr/CflA subfamily [Zymomonas mobilis subsp. mobilis ZM4 = ATCC 31821]AEH62854.1 drug resistance transporter, Bcr/CflA subfamily [Zymomonas mobilis subsp. mobilis ATCC 10988]AHB10093.1 drug resistance transporter, Bcr/CflA subfamily [Zymomonas mobilis subsp. mobilis str. CP4 = NRRL B-14023]AHJ70399.1 Sulfonamide resistance protein [Zymomonas mobilis subsp. mobilis NRRL B-12526]AHJ72254.1 Sulfonamide